MMPFRSGCRSTLCILGNSSIDAAPTSCKAVLDSSVHNIIVLVNCPSDSVASKTVVFGPKQPVFVYIIFELY